MMRRRLLALGIGLGLAGATAVAVPAEAADVVSAPLASSTTAALQVANFWLADEGANLKSATPYAPPSEIRGERTSDAFVPPGKPGQVIPDPPEAEGEPARTSGKVFFVGADGQPRWCSGTAVQSQYRNLVATASSPPRAR
ncbi:hypothetical protein [Nonomuraea roseoviolacea]|uniref:Uncharacterized protein n=1 Tax=Nonomuraea roseoviolacea subsp. carminata TaxID=160689 RepID=A0ABT1K0L5_9ACTN|nr:hypothetical protein [Nonomuraea roseoviolacea]MCP2347535.1 hypothetical protein [Nonomuraea roseoviolacea subsp. carminata]